MNICLCSAFRDSEPYLDRYVAQVDALGRMITARGDRFAMVWGEGDSEDQTLKRLILAAEGIPWPVRRVDCTHGGRRYGSVVAAERFRQLAYVGRQIFATVPPGADVVIYVESDLIWRPETMTGLIEHLIPGVMADPVPYSRPAPITAVAPPVLLNRRGWPPTSWYDTLAFVADGQHFTHRRPWHPATVGQTRIQLDTAGSCLAMRADWARLAGAQMGERLLMGMCEQFREWGGSIWLDLTVPAVIHE